MVVMNKKMNFSILLQLQVIPLIKGKLAVKGKREVQACQLIKKLELNTKRREIYQRKKDSERSCS